MVMALTVQIIGGEERNKTIEVMIGVLEEEVEVVILREAKEEELIKRIIELRHKTMIK